jgi:superfamily II DNA or RNA helicase
LPFNQQVRIAGNTQLRIPQREGWEVIRNHFAQANPERDVGLVLPVGCGKSGLIAITPFALAARRVLVIAPGTKIRDQLGADLRANSEHNFYERCGVISADQEFPETTVVASGRFNLDDVRHSDVAVANIHQIAGEDDHWLDELGPDFFDLVLFDEGHHNTAESWQQVKRRFRNAAIINYSATPSRADGELMQGRIIYSFPVVEAIRAGYVKRLRARCLNPTELVYIDRTSGQERRIGPDEVRRLGEDEAEFRRGIVMSDETLSSIVDQSLNELQALRERSGEPRLKIIASALNYDHCIQITEAFRARGARAGWVHSREGGNANERVFADLEGHQLDVIVQARMLGEGFDHKFLAVAMVGSIFRSLSPFVQFVGRVMRAVVQNDPRHPANEGVVVFHAGCNVAQRWDDFRAFSTADQQFFAELLPEADDVPFQGRLAVDFVPGAGGGIQPIEIIAEHGVSAAELHPIAPEAEALLQQLAEMGVDPEQAAAEIRRRRMTRQDRREARRAALNERIQNEIGGIFGRANVPHRGRKLDPRRRVANYEWAVAELNRRVNERVGGDNADRQNFTLDQLDTAHEVLEELVRQLEEEIRRNAA